MAFLLAPYNEAMRLGMGFNSFTQQLCINDAVKLTGGKESATEKTLRPQYIKGTMTGLNGSNVNTSQEVTWSAKFVDRISEVTDSLNVSGSLQIKCDAIGGGGSASASFVDTNKFKESDINYWIQVKVTNQRLESPDLTDFSPIKNVSQSEFTRVYGDSFISGFTEGGEFNALVSIKLRDHSKAKEIRGQLKVEMDFKAASLSGEGKVEKTSGEMNIDGETTIAVSWRGGGDIKDENVEDWTLATLKAVAMEFPEKVLACPMRTNAILTKYTALKSFYETNLKGTPLDYENAGVYSSALLDAYMDYKVMWRNISTAIWEVEEGQSELFLKRDVPELAELNREFKEHYQRQSDSYKQKMLDYEHNGTSAIDTESDGSWASVDQKTVAPSGTADTDDAEHKSLAQPMNLAASTRSSPEKPIPPNDLIPYKNSIFGLEKARRDCRFEMIKIVREVDAVTNDPRVAGDPRRTLQYLSPTVFRMLLPTVKNLDKARAAEKAAEEAKLANEASTKAQEQLRSELTEAKRQLGATEEKLRAKEQTVNELIPYGGWCPVPLDTPVRFRSYSSKKSLDYGANSVHLWDWAVNNTNQKWVISRAGALGFYIRHFDTGRYLATGNAGSDGLAYLTAHEIGSVFTFQQQLDKGTVMIHLADKNQFTMVIEGGRSDNGAKIIMWPNFKNDNDRWFVKRFEDPNL